MVVAADLDRLALGLHAHAGALAEVLGRADPGTHAAQDVGVKDRHRRRIGRARRDLADEQRDVDAGRAGGDAGRIVAEITAVGRDARLVPGQGRCDIGKVHREFMGGKAAGNDARRQSCLGHLRLLAHLLARIRLTQAEFFIKW